MSPANFAVLEPSLVRVDLAKSEELVSPGRPIEHCWFIEDGIASMVAMSHNGQETEAGIVGREGMVDVATILGSDRSPLRCFIQIPGHGLRIPASVLASARDASPTLRALLDRYAYSLMAQIANTALANASLTVEERLARWLLMCADRIGSDEIALTHEFLSLMLNVRRAGVTLAIHSLERAGWVKGRRGAILIVDRAGLEACAFEAYVPLDEPRTMIGDRKSAEPGKPSG